MSLWKSLKPVSVVPDFWKEFELLVKIKGTLMQIWKYANIFAFIWKQIVEDFTLKQLLLFEMCAHEMCEKFVYKHSEIIEYVKN